LKRFTQAVCDLSRTDMSAHGAPVRNRQKIPFNTREPAPAKATAIAPPAKKVRISAGASMP
jgi:hypothetical protein